VRDPSSANYQLRLCPLATLRASGVSLSPRPIGAPLILSFWSPTALQWSRNCFAGARHPKQFLNIGG
jgi:hypothetical protein